MRGLSTITSASLDPCSGKIRFSVSARAFLGIDERGQRVDVDPHGLRGILALFERLGEHHGDRLSDESDPAVGQRRPGEVRVHHGESVMRRDAEFGGREDLDDARHRTCVVGMDGADGAVSDLGAHEDRVEFVLEVEIREVLPAPGEQAGVLGAQYPGTEDRSGSLRLVVSHRRRTYFQCRSELGGEGVEATLVVGEVEVTDGGSGRVEMRARFETVRGRSVTPPSRGACGRSMAVSGTPRAARRRLRTTRPRCHARRVHRGGALGTGRPTRGGSRPSRVVFPSWAPVRR